jgi:hypothetical protein
VGRCRPLIGDDRGAKVQAWSQVMYSRHGVLGVFLRKPVPGFAQSMNCNESIYTIDIFL